MQRELVQAQSLLADLLLDAFSHHSSQHRRARNEMKEKSSVEKVSLLQQWYPLYVLNTYVLFVQLIYDFVREEPSLSLMEQEWEDINQ